MQPTPIACGWDDLWSAVSSSNVEAIRRCGEYGRDLEVKFLAKGKRPSTIYRYLGAGWRYDDMLAAGSKGVFVHRNLIPNYVAMRIA
jgi:hypothetical protein